MEQPETMMQRIGWFLHQVFILLVHIVCRIVYGFQAKKTVPAITNRLLMDSAVSLARRIRQREVMSNDTTFGEREK